MNRHLGVALTAFVDGELDDDGREEVQVHLAHCPSCRGDLQLLRSLKSTLRAEPQTAPADLASRILALSAVPGQPALVARPPVVRDHSRVRRAAVGFGALALGFGGALAVAGSPHTPVAPLDPANAGFVVEHSSTANEVPFAGSDVAPVAHPVSSP
jgi:anti-sigma factor RsiW